MDKTEQNMSKDKQIAERMLDNLEQQKRAILRDKEKLNNALADINIWINYLIKLISKP